MWGCPRAQELWTRVARHWGTLRLSLATLKTAVFSLTAPATTIDWTTSLGAEVAGQHDCTEMQERLDLWLGTGWRQLVIMMVRQLWTAHSDATHRPDVSPASANDAEDYFTVLYRWAQQLRGTQSYLDSDRSSSYSPVDRTIQQRLCKGFIITHSDLPRLAVKANDPEFVLFFDSGSRGNPGPGGSGAVIVRVARGAATAALLWAASHSMAGWTTTNNTAEYHGLILGLLAAKQYRWHPLTVVGDSKLILSHMAKKAPLRTSTLRRRYHRVLAAKDGLYVQAWVHHYRDYNKTADKAANVTMDTKTSIQAFADAARPEHEAIGWWLSNDIDHLLANQAENHHSVRSR